MRANKIVISLNITEDGRFSLNSSFKILKKYKFTFQTAEEFFSNGVIIRIALSRHTLINMVNGQQLPEDRGTILGTSIRVEDEMIRRILTINRHYESITDKIRINPVGERITDNFLGA